MESFLVATSTCMAGDLNDNLVMIWSIYIALNQAMASSWEYISLGLWGTLERLWKLKSSQHRFSTIILERKASRWDDIEGNLLIRFTGLFHQWEFPCLAVTYVHSLFCSDSLSPTKIPPQLTLASGVKRSGWQAANEQSGCQICLGFIYISCWIYK